MSRVESRGSRARTERAFLLGLLTLWAGFASSSLADDISVVATVDQASIAFGDSLVYTIEVKGAQSGIQPNVPRIEGLRFDGPSSRVSTMIVNGVVNQSVQLQYAVTPSRKGEFIIPAIEVDVGGTKYATQPIKITVVENAMQEGLKDSLYAKVRFGLAKLYVGQPAPIEVCLFVREGVPLKGLGGFQCDSAELGYKYLDKLKSSTQVINGQKYSLHAVEGVISPTKTGRFTFGPCALQAQLQVERRKRSGGSQFDDPFFAQFFGNTEIRQVPVTTEPVSIEVLPLPEEGKPAEFAGAVGRWTLTVTADKTSIAVGDPITMTARIEGDGNIDMVPPVKLGEVSNFKTYEPSSKTSRNDLGMQGAREFQQVLVPLDTSVTQLPEVRFAYFDPIDGKYKVARSETIRLAVKAAAGGIAVITPAGGSKQRSKEKLGQDIVYLKGDPGPGAAVPFCTTPTFWVLNAAPMLALVGAVAWKRRTDKLRGDVAYARRTRGAKVARKLLADATRFDQVQRALQSYLGDRLNIPASGITASIVEEQLIPRGLNGELATELRSCFEVCDTARFAGGIGSQLDLAPVRGKVERLIDELEKKQI